MVIYRENFIYLFLSLHPNRISVARTLLLPDTKYRISHRYAPYKYVPHKHASTGVHLTGVHLAGVHLTDVHYYFLPRSSPSRSRSGPKSSSEIEPPRQSRSRICDHSTFTTTPTDGET